MQQINWTIHTSVFRKIVVSDDEPNVCKYLFAVGEKQQANTPVKYIGPWSYMSTYIEAKYKEMEGRPIFCFPYIQG